MWGQGGGNTFSSILLYENKFGKTGIIKRVLDLESKVSCSSCDLGKSQPL